MEKFLQRCALSRATTYGLFARLTSVCHTRRLSFENSLIGGSQLYSANRTSINLERQFHKNKYLSPKIDIVFRKVFGTNENKDILKDFLNSILNLKGQHCIKKLNILNPIQDPHIISKKQSVLDVLCKDSVGTCFACEMQVARTDFFLKRLQHYAAKLYSIQAAKAKTYGTLKKVYMIVIVDYDLFANKQNYISRHKFLDEITYEIHLDDICFLFLELPKFVKSLDELHTPQDKWIFYLKNASKMNRNDVKKFANTNTLKKAFKVLEQFNWSEEEFIIYHCQLKKHLNDKAVFNEGLNEVFTKQAKAMLNDGMPVHIIAKYVNLTEEQILKIKKKFFM